MDLLGVIHRRQQQLQRFMNQIIERLARKEIDKSKRYYELQYGQPLSEQEEIEIKKGIVLRLGFFVFIPLLILFLTLMERGMSG
ncbi:hypothetical protein C7437_11213 [Psychrobacillus insolitus]|uniref:Uncharacterized protein n=1 Tax=Psychrobacillus insolitus TaxID=1461 RepID=A0A2W7MBX5_9BACI|nr:hypothetical protein [Psychrobacillus insolitus]PZX02374.1 hypothetical protein C7437_11213 [Psychrobacillus insolitus]